MLALNCATLIAINTILLESPHSASVPNCCFEPALRRLLLALIATFSFTAAAHAAEPPAPVVADARAILSENPFNPDFQTDKGFYRNVDVNGDGKKDWVLDFMNAQAQAYCGTGGCPLRVWVFEPADQSWTLELAMRHFRYTLPHKGEMNVDVHGIYCGGTGGDACRLDYIWDVKAKAFVQKPGKDGVALLIYAPRPVNENEPPSAVWALQAAFSTACVLKGGKPDVENSLVSVPDLNGDGVRDWVFDGTAAYCSTKEGDQIMPPCNGGECAVEAFVTDARTAGGARRVYRGEAFWRVAYHKNAPADLMTLPYDAECGGPKQKPCVYRKAALTLD